MLFQNKHVFCLVMTLVFSSCFSSFPDYEFKVYPVKKCPMDKEAWDLSSIRLNCNRTHGYHCVPNKFLTSLIEFCYPWGEKILFGEGNCLELADTGILNHVPCNETFSSGCPDSYYYGDEIYKYPQCLAINTTLRCFEHDTKCIKSRLVERSTVERNGTAEQTESSTKAHSGNDSVHVVVIIILSILLAVAFLYITYLLCKRKGCPLMHIKDRRRRKSTPNKKMENEMDAFDNYIPHMSYEETNRAYNRIVNESEISSQSDPQSFPSPSNDERDSFHEYTSGRNALASREDSCQSDPQSFSSQFQEQINEGYENDEFPSVSNVKRMSKSRKNTSRPFVHSCTCTSSNPSPMMLHHVVECVPCNHQQFPSEDEIAACMLAACVFARLRRNTSLPDKVAAPTNLPGVIDFVQGTTKTFGTESENGSILLNEDDTEYSECDDDSVNLQNQANANDLHHRQSDYSYIDHPTCFQKPRTMKMDEEKGESVVGIKKVSKQTKEEAPLERAKSIASSKSTKKSEHKEKKKGVLSFDNIKDERKKEQLRPRERRMRDEEWEIEQEKKKQKNVDLRQGADNRRLAREKEKIRKDRDQLEKENLELRLECDELERKLHDKRRLKQLKKMERSNARDDCKDSFQRERSDKRDERDSDRRRARAFLGNSRSELKSERERQKYNDTINFDLETSLSIDNCQGVNSNSSQQDDREMPQSKTTCYSIPDNLGSAPSFQKNWKSSSDIGEVKNSWSASRKQINNRSSGSQPQNRLTRDILGLQADTQQQTSSTPTFSGLFEAGGQNM